MLWNLFVFSFKIFVKEIMLIRWVWMNGVVWCNVIYSVYFFILSYSIFTVSNLIISVIFTLTTNKCIVHLNINLNKYPTRPDSTRPDSTSNFLTLINFFWFSATKQMLPLLTNPLLVYLLSSRKSISCLFVPLKSPFKPHIS